MGSATSCKRVWKWQPPNWETETLAFFSGINWNWDPKKALETSKLGFEEEKQLSGIGKVRISTGNGASKVMRSR